MSTRSRTLLFISYRDSKARATKYSRRSSYVPQLDDDSESAALIPGPSSPSTSQQHLAINLDVALPPRWVDTSDRVEGLLVQLQGKIAQLDKLHAKHVLPGFADRTQEERDIDALTADITRDFRACHKLVHSIVPPPTTSYPPGKDAPNTDPAARNLQRALAAKLQDASAAFRKKQRVYMDKLTGHATKNADLLVASGAVSLRGSESAQAVEEDVQMSAQTLQTQTRSTDPSLTARSAELAHLAQSISGLADLFKDLSSLVVEQGTILDSVEYNIEMAASELKEAEGELKVAQR
ncbi:t-SNARE [Exidia glandulosa HHB12029]|uniref:t-SNARE n=1 Tax=Exidia glandulosa HHB12029 TaxID=1314781 RepID=A0A165FW48_EXIGL|nr:t-SNARE [Exidia glandulosa HHB12029]